MDCEFQRFRKPETAGTYTLQDKTQLCLRRVLTHLSRNYSTYRNAGKCAILLGLRANTQRQQAPVVGPGQ